MQISSKEVTALVALASVIFLIAPLFLILYVLSYNRKKKKHAEEKTAMQKNYQVELLKAQMEVKEQTLKTIAYDLHDNIGQLLSLTSVTLSSINLNDTEKAKEKIATADDLAKRSIKEVKALSRLLQGDELINVGLINAIDVELKLLQRSELYLINFEHANYSGEAQDRDKDLLIFRLFQEMLNNIIQHAKADEISIRLEDHQQLLKLTIKDNGIGFNVDETLNRKTGMGLSNIQKRTTLLNGAVSIHSQSDGGTEITVTIPLN